MVESLRAAVASVQVVAVPIAVAPSNAWNRTEANRPVLFSKWRSETVTEFNVSDAPIVVANP